MTTIDPAILAKFVEKYGPEPHLPFDIRGNENLRAAHFLWHAKLAGYQLCAAEKQAEIDELKRMDDITMTAFNRAVDRAEMAEARIATLEQQRQQDFEAKHQPNTSKGAPP